MVKKDCGCCIGLSYEFFSVRLNVDGLTRVDFVQGGKIPDGALI